MNKPGSSRRLFFIVLILLFIVMFAVGGYRARLFSSSLVASLEVVELDEGPSPISAGPSPVIAEPTAKEERAPVVSTLMVEAVDRGLQREVFSALCDARDVEGELRCDRCPSEFSREGPLYLEKAYIGKIIEEGPRYAILGVEGCAQGWNFRKGAVLLQEDGESWRVVEQSPEMDTSNCEAFSFPEQQVLVCQDVEMGQGRVTTHVKALWADDGELRSALLFSIDDRSGTCRYLGEFSTRLDGLVAADVTGDGEEELLALLTVKRGSYLSEPEGGGSCDDLELGRVLVREKQRRYAYTWRWEGPVEVLISDERIPAPVYEEYFSGSGEFD